MGKRRMAIIPNILYAVAVNALPVPANDVLKGRLDICAMTSPEHTARESGGDADSAPADERAVLGRSNHIEQ